MSTIEEQVRRRAVAIRDVDHDFARVAKCLAIGRGWNESAVAAAEKLYPGSGLDFSIKAAVSATTTGSNDGEALLRTPGAASFQGMVRATAAFGQIPGWRRVPLNRPASYATAGASASFVGEGQPVPPVQLTFSAASLPSRKVVGLSVFTMDVARDPSSEADGVVQRDMVDADAAAIDSVMFSAAPEDAGVAPAGLLNGITPAASSGDVALDLRTLLSGFTSLSGVAVLMSELALIETITQIPGAVTDGRLFGVVPLAVSGAAGSNIIALRAPDIFLAEGSVSVDTSMHATVEMLDESLVQDATDGTGTTLLPLWQSNSVGIRTTHFINWRRRNTSAVRYIADASYGAS